jgi:23S rRNA pseudouridine1911/1915/1917 synthase
MLPTREHAVTISDAESGQRLDVSLARALPDHTRSRLQALIRDGAVTDATGETITMPGHRVKPGEVYGIGIPEPEPAVPLGEAIPLTVVFEDEWLIVIDKPAGLVVHPSAGHANGTLVNALIAHCGSSLSGIGGIRRPGIVHRLDKNTSGLMVVAKTDAAHSSLAQQFAAHGSDGRLERGYAALVWGAPEPSAGRIETLIGRKAQDRTRMAVVRDKGRHAATQYATIARFPKQVGKATTVSTSLVRCTLETGRTHQVRVHLAHIGHPILGDDTYASGFVTRISKLGPLAQDALHNLARQALHAELLAFEHPRTGKGLRFTSALPDDIARLKLNLAAGQ